MLKQESARTQQDIDRLQAEIAEANRKQGAFAGHSSLTLTLSYSHTLTLTLSFKLTTSA